MSDCQSTMKTAALGCRACLLCSWRGVPPVCGDMAMKLSGFQATTGWLMGAQMTP